MSEPERDMAEIEKRGAAAEAKYRASLRLHACARALSGVEDPEGAVRALVDALERWECGDSAVRLTGHDPHALEALVHDTRRALAPFTAARARNDETEEPRNA